MYRSMPLFCSFFSSLLFSLASFSFSSLIRTTSGTTNSSPSLSLCMFCIALFTWISSCSFSFCASKTTSTVHSILSFLCNAWGVRRRRRKKEKRVMSMFGITSLLLVSHRHSIMSNCKEEKRWINIIIIEHRISSSVDCIRRNQRFLQKYIQGQVATHRAEVWLRGMSLLGADKMTELLNHS